MAAAHAGKPKLVRKLLAAGARIDPVDRVRNGHADTARWLIGHGADRSLRDDPGKTAADIAREQNYLELAQLLQP
ncbi:hypothetical protein JJ685_21450 [Ramlibacter monticola]|uniref:Ankyrin repeat domain-containing protein n=1 Tax=Ramlibacter monticola TaxID=1926872 RepID=A0A936Z3K7_9BURK|nr:hypothetical protein [Ramlibacter monticola]MBL0393717.1 hypothetical protein [Ramlibacter monticola]